MGFRVPAPDGKKSDDGLPLLVISPGTVLKGRYKVEYFAVGGTSIVYSGIREGEKYLLKEVDASDSKKVIAINQEKFILERLNHPGIVKVYDLFEEDGFYYLVLEYIDGESMEKLISPFPDVFIQEKIIINWALQLCDIFEYLHKQKPPIIYRDLKPKNLIKDRNGKVHLIDFGIARVFKQGRSRDTEAMGTALTASPEHYGGAQTDERSDIFTLGATLNYFITNGRGIGEEPFEFYPVRSINPKISENLEQVIKKAIELDPRKRYQTIKEMRQAFLNSREVPLPVIEPFGDGKAKGDTGEMKEAGATTVILEEKFNLLNNLKSGYTGIFVALSSVLVIILGIVMINFFMKPQKENNYRTNYIKQSYLSGNPQNPMTNRNFGNQAPKQGLDAVENVNPKRPPFPDSIHNQNSIIQNQQHPGIQGRQPPYQNPGMIGPGQGVGFNNQAFQAPPSFPVIKAGEPFVFDLIRQDKIYRDEKNKFELVIPVGWIVDDSELSMQPAGNFHCVAAFSHLPPPSTENPGQRPERDILMIIIKNNKKGNPLSMERYMDEWLNNDVKYVKGQRFMEVNKLLSENGRLFFQTSFFSSNGSRIIELRDIRMDPETSELAFIKSQYNENISNRHFNYGMTQRYDMDAEIFRSMSMDILKKFRFIN